jgi:hypothetical protein
MNKNITNLLFFVAGLGIGSVVTWKVVDAKYRQIAHDEYEEMREYYEGKARKLEEDIVEDTPSDDDTNNYTKVVSELNYGVSETIKKGGPDNVERPYVIKPEEFDEGLDGYNSVSLTYYNDGILADDDDEIVDDIDAIVGLESLKHFGEYAEDPDSVFVRNDALKCDYEICLDLRNFSDVTGYSRPVAE